MLVAIDTEALHLAVLLKARKERMQQEENVVVDIPLLTLLESQAAEKHLAAKVVGVHGKNNRLIAKESLVSKQKLESVEQTQQQLELKNAVSLELQKAALKLVRI